MEQQTNILHAVVKKAKNGNNEALAFLYNQYSKAMFNICSRMCGSKAIAEDILQESFLIAFKNIAQLKNAALFGGWLKQIVINECIRHSKKNFTWEDWDDAFENFLPTEEISWWKEVELSTINDAIKLLPDGCRQVFNLFVLEDYTHKDIAASLGISESTSKSQYHRARKLLKEKVVKKLEANGQF